MSKTPKCPGCNEADAIYRQDGDRAHLCGWCGYNHDTGEHAELVPAALDDDDWFLTDKWEDAADV